MSHKYLKSLIENLRGNPRIHAWEESDFEVGNTKCFRLKTFRFWVDRYAFREYIRI